MEEKIRIENVTKKFGSYAALDGISLSFEKRKNSRNDRKKRKWEDGTV